MNVHSPGAIPRPGALATPLPPSELHELNVTIWPVNVSLEGVEVEEVKLGEEAAQVEVQVIQSRDVQL